MNKIFVIVFLLALFLRLAYIAAVPARSLTLDDSFEWNRTAVTFYHGQGFLSQTQNLDPKRPPVYPLFIASVYRVFGLENFTALKNAQAVLGAATCVILAWIALLLFGVKIAWFTGLFAAVYPPLIVYCEILQSETIFTFLLGAFVLSWIVASRKEKWNYFILSGTLLALLTLCRGTTLLFPFFLMVFVLAFSSQRLLWRQYVVMIACSVVFLVPWTWRNYQVYKMFIPSAGGSSESFWAGTLPLEVQDHYGDKDVFKKLQLSSDPREMDKIYKKAALENIKKNPLAYAVLTVKKVGFFLLKPVGEEIVSRKSLWASYVVFGLYWGLLILVLIGVGYAGISAELGFFYLIILYFVTLHSLVNPMPRYRLPIEQFFLIFAVQGFLRYFKKHE